MLRRSWRDSTEERTVTWRKWSSCPGLITRNLRRRKRCETHRVSRSETQGLVSGQESMFHLLFESIWCSRCHTQLVSDRYRGQNELMLLFIVSVVSVRCSVPVLTSSCSHELCMLLCFHRWYYPPPLLFFWVFPRPLNIVPNVFCVFLVPSSAGGHNPRCITWLSIQQATVNP